MKVEIFNHTTGKGNTFSTECPHCGSYGTFEPIQSLQELRGIPASKYWELGVAKCPNSKCRGHLFYVYDFRKSNYIDLHPKCLVSFDTSKVPDKIVLAFQEAITCFSQGCYTASAIMVRKTLEEVCNERQATGPNLFKRIESLKSKVVLPAALLEGIHELRLLGNDAAHIDLATFPEIGQEELTLAIDVTKELLKGLYQYENLVDRFEKLKQKQSSSAGSPLPSNAGNKNQ